MTPLAPLMPTMILRFMPTSVNSAQYTHRPQRRVRPTRVEFPAQAPGRTKERAVALDFGPL